MTDQTSPQSNPLSAEGHEAMTDQAQPTALPLTQEERAALSDLASAAVPNWTQWTAESHEDWAQPQTYVEAKDKWGDRISIVRFVEGEPHFWCTIGKAEYEWANAKFIAAASPYTIKRLLATLQAAESQIVKMKESQRTAGCHEVCDTCGRKTEDFPKHGCIASPRCPVNIRAAQGGDAPRT